MLFISTPDTTSAAAIEYSIFQLIVEKRLKTIDDQGKEELQDALKSYNRMSARLTCNCKDGRAAPTYRPASHRGQYRLVQTNKNAHAPGCQLLRHQDAERDLTIQSRLSEELLSKLSPVFLYRGGTDPRQNPIDWLLTDLAEYESPNSFEFDEFFAVSSVGYHDLVDMMQNQRLEKGSVLSRAKITRAGLSLNLVGGGDEISLPVHGPIWDVSGHNAGTGETMAMVNFQLNRDRQTVAHQALLFTMPNSGHCIPASSVELRWAVFTLVDKILYAQKLHQDHSIHVEFVYQNGGENPSSFRLHAHGQVTEIPIHFRKTPEGYKGQDLPNFLVVNPDRRSLLQKRQILKSHFKFKSLLQELLLINPTVS